MWFVKVKLLCVVDYACMHVLYRLSVIIVLLHVLLYYFFASTCTIINFTCTKVDLHRVQRSPSLLLNMLQYSSKDLESVCLT